MQVFDYFNLIEWLFALVSLIAWARFSTFMCEDITKNLVDQPELPWKLAAGGVMLVMLAVYIIMPFFWLALVINLLIAGGMIGYFWSIRVKALGPAGHLFKRALQAVEKSNRAREDRGAARQVQLTYQRHDGSAMPLPRPGDPLAAGLGVADQIVIQALLRRAEIVDLGPSQGGSYSLTLITDGIPAAPSSVDRTSAEAAIQALKVLGGLSAEERRRPQQGSFRSKDGEGNSITWSVKTSGSTAGERVVLLANEKGQWELPLETLGMTSEQLNSVKKLTTSTQGLVLVTGPRGTGKTTTLYAMLRLHDAFTNSVQSLEVNPQTEIEGVTINRFENRADASFPKLLQSIMLKDPNILLVSQIPDGPTAELITKYTNPGDTDAHRVYTTLPAGDTFAAVEMWQAMNTNKSAAANGLTAVVAQRLVRILCPTCKIPYQPDESTLKRLNLPVGRNLQSFRANTEPIIDKRGRSVTCPECGGIGFRGRTGIFEVLVINDEMRQAIASGASQNQLRLMARKNNLMLLIEHGIRKFATGVTAINEVTRTIGAAQGGGASGSTKAGTK